MTAYRSLKSIANQAVATKLVKLDVGFMYLIQFPKKFQTDILNRRQCKFEGKTNNNHLSYWSLVYFFPNKPSYILHINLINNK